jgi:trehalose synthase
VEELAITATAVSRFGDVLDEAELARFAATMDQVRERLGGRDVWHINSTAEGGGVAEMLQSILGYPLDAGVSVRWLVIGGNDEFFAVTKRIHHLLHGSAGDGGPLGEHERGIYESALAPEVAELVELIRPGDPVVLHDPQTLGLAPALADLGAHIIWSCHIGADEPNEHTRTAWRFLDRYVASTRYQVFSRRQYAWENLDPSGIAVIPPCLDAFSPKNQRLDDDTVTAILDAAGIVAGRSPAAATFRYRDGSAGRVTSRAELIEDAPVPAGAAIVTQISRWDPLKDHAGVMRGFCEHGPAASGAHLVLAGPAPAAITDDPEGQQTLTELCAARAALAPELRRLVHIACLPMSDIDENAAIVNALQRRSDVIVQKSLAEGFGLTVAEAMWKARPTVGSDVGGIQDQIEPGVSGVLVEPDDLAQFGAAVNSLLHEPERAAALGQGGRDRVVADYLAPQHLSRYFQRVEAVLR